MFDSIKEYLTPELIWFLVGLVLLVLEFAMPGLIVFFFGVAAVVVAVVCLASSYVAGSINAQLAIFIGCAVMSLLLLRRWLKGVFLGHTTSKQDLRENLEDFVGQKAVVREKITPKAGGKVEFHGTSWQARADVEIAEGTVVEITGKDNITLIVKPM